jgi:hypothetical protein
MKFIINIKFLIFLISVSLTLSTNLKITKNLEAKSTYYTNFNNNNNNMKNKNKNKNKIINLNIEKINDNKQNKKQYEKEKEEKKLINNFFSFPSKLTNTINYMEIFSDIGDKTFICVILLYFTSCGYYLFISTLIMKLIQEYTKNFLLIGNLIPGNYLFKIIFPIKIFQFIGVIYFQLCGYSILFKLIFRNSDSYENTKNENNENLEEKYTPQEKLRMLFIILFSFFSSFDFEENNENINNNFTLFKFIMKLIQSLIALIIAFFIANFIYKKFSKNSTLIFTSITFLLISVDGAIKLFSY